MSGQMHRSLDPGGENLHSRGPENGLLRKKGKSNLYHCRARQHTLSPFCLCVAIRCRRYIRNVPTLARWGVFGKCRDDRDRIWVPWGGGGATNQPPDVQINAHGESRSASSKNGWPATHQSIRPGPDRTDVLPAFPRLDWKTFLPAFTLLWVIHEWEARGPLPDR